MLTLWAQWFTSHVKDNSCRKTGSTEAAANCFLRGSGVLSLHGRAISPICKNNNHSWSVGAQDMYLLLMLYYSFLKNDIQPKAMTHVY